MKECKPKVNAKQEMGNRDMSIFRSLSEISTAGTQTQVTKINKFSSSVSRFREEPQFRT